MRRQPKSTTTLDPGGQVPKPQNNFRRQQNSQSGRREISAPMDLDPLVQEELEETTATLDVLSEGDEEPDGLLTSLHALFYLPCRLNGRSITAMLDSGACANFISEKLVKELNLPLKPLKKSLKVRAASGCQLSITHFVRARLEFTSFTLRVSLRVAAMAPTLILGATFLRAYNPHIDWQTNKVELRYQGKVHQLQVLSTLPPGLNVSLCAGDEDYPQRTNLGSNASDYLANANNSATEDLSTDSEGLRRTKMQSTRELHLCTLNELEGPDVLFLVKLEPQPDNLTNEPLNVIDKPLNEVTGTNEFLPRLQNLNPKIQSLLLEYSDVFQPLPSQLPPDRGVSHRIQLYPKAQPPAHRLYRMSPLEEEELKRQMQKYLEAGWIEKAQSPFGAGVLFAKKKDGSFRLCIDYRSLNKLTIKDKYPLPRIEECLDEMQGSERFTKLDLASGYHQVRMHPADIQKTAFQTKYGSFQFRVLPFGLCNAPATFQRLMNTVLSPYLNRCAKAYLDDVVIHSRNAEEHVEDLRRILQLLRENQLFCQLKKCEFDKPEIEFCGFRISKEGIRPQTEKVKLIKAWPTPKNQTDIRAFLGFCGFYRRFIKNFAKIASPITELLQKEKTWEWGDEEQHSFEQLRKALSENALLTLPDVRKPYYLYTDASDQAIAATLNQKNDRGILQLLACSSRKLSKAERNYPTQEKEMLSLVYHLQHWRHYLLGVKCFVFTDSTAVTWLQTSPHPSPRQVRWLGKLAEYDLEIKHIAGKLNTAADSLTRTSFDLNPIARSSDSHETGWEHDYLNDDFIKTTYFNVDGMPKQPGNYRQGYLWEKDRIVVPAAKENVVIAQFHDGKTAGHFGAYKTEDLIARRYILPKLREKVKVYVSQCDKCQRHKAERQKQRGLLHSLPLPNRPWQSLSMD